MMSILIAKSANELPRLKNWVLEKPHTRKEAAPYKRERHVLVWQSRI